MCNLVALGSRIVTTNSNDLLRSVTGGIRTPVTDTEFSLIICVLEIPSDLTLLWRSW